MSVIPKERLYVVIGLNEESYRMNAVSCRSLSNNNDQTLCNFPHVKCFCTKKIHANKINLLMPKNDNKNKNPSDFLIV